MLEKLMAMAAKRVRLFGPSELTFVLDGMARLNIKAPTTLLTALAKQVIHVMPLRIPDGGPCHL